MLARPGAGLLAVALIDVLGSRDAMPVAGATSTPASGGPANTDGLVQDAPSGHSRRWDQP